MEIDIERKMFEINRSYLDRTTETTKPTETLAEPSTADNIAIVPEGIPSTLSTPIEIDIEIPGAPRPMEFRERDNNVPVVISVPGRRKRTIIEQRREKTKSKEQARRRNCTHHERLS